MKSALLTALAAVVFHGVAPAATIQETLVGTIQGLDDGGFFGGGPLSGAATLLIGYDTALIGADATHGSNSAQDYYLDSSGDSAVGESLTIGSDTFAILSTSFGELYAQDDAPGTYETILAENSGFAFETDLISPLAFSTGRLFDQSILDTLVSDSTLFLTLENTSTQSKTQAGFTPTATPEPSTWILLAPGLSGLALKRRRRTAERDST